jgi:hypothetical protein
LLSATHHLLAHLPYFAFALDPVAGEDLDWLSNAPWAKVGLIITVAVFVLTIGGTLAKRRTGGRSVRGAGRRDFDLQIAKLESLPVSPIAGASTGPVHFEGVLSSANETLGGSPESGRVYHNRKGASRKAAVASELVLLRDSSGQASIECLDLARVIAAKDPKAGGRSQAADTISLHIGDRVQVLGYFRAELHGDDAQAADRVFGVMGDDGQIQVRLLERSKMDPPSAAPQTGSSANTAQVEATSADEGTPSPAEG